MNIFTQIFSIIPFFQILALHKITFLGMPFYGLEVVFLWSIFILSFYKAKFDKKRLPDKVIMVAALLFLGGATLSTLLNAYNHTNLGQLKSWILVPVAYFFIGVLFFPQEERVKIWQAWFFGTFLINMVAIYGYLMGYLTYDHRLAFPFTSPNFLAYLLVPGILMTPLFVIRFIGWKKGVAVVNFFVSLIVLYQTHSYSNWLALLVSIFVGLTIFWYKNKKSILKKHVFFGILLGIFLGGMFFGIETKQPKWVNIFTSNRSSIDSRFMIWQAAWSIGKDHPLNGIGVGNFQNFYLAKQKEFPPYLEWAVPEPHNFWLAVWLQSGLLGVFGIALLIARLGWIFVKKFSLEVNTKNVEGYLIVSLWVAFLIYGMFDTPYFRNDLAFLFWTQVLITYFYSMNTSKEN